MGILIPYVDPDLDLIPCFLTLIKPCNNSALYMIGSLSYPGFLSRNEMVFLTVKDPDADRIDTIQIRHTGVHGIENSMMTPVGWQPQLHEDPDGCPPQPQEVHAAC